MLLFKREILCTLSLDQLNAARTALNKAGIHYTYRARSHQDMPPFRSPSRNMMGRVGERLDANTLYYLYVRPADYEQARAVVGSTR